ncbi:aminotransferase class V-fold PLP-dependent enzyme [Lentzea sp. NPDC004789]
MNVDDFIRPLLDEWTTGPLPGQFPGRRDGEHRFDGSGGTLVHGAVVAAVARYLGSGLVANDHGGFPASDFSDAVVSWSAARLRELLGAPDGDVVFGPNMTGLTTTFVRSVAAGLRPGDEIVVTKLDHEANRAPWLALADRGVVVREALLDPSGALPVRAVTDLIGARTRWVAVTAASNALGFVPDVRAVAEAAHAVGAKVFVDGVQAVAHRRAEMTELGCDAFVTASYKWYGPHAGMLWLAPGVSAGARLAEQVPSAEPDGPGHLQLGTTNFEAVLGAGVAAAVLSRWDHAAVAEREQRLGDALRAGVAELPQVRVLSAGPEHERVPLVTFQVDGMPAEVVAKHLTERRISVWHGTFYASAAMRSVTEGDAVRAGIACYTGEADVDALVRALAGVVRA